jgi:(S)-2-hydroxyglutarate dehydrogenase
MKLGSFDFLIIGAGIIGLNIALLLKKQFASSKVCLIEKEDEAGLHASGRNSGVLHAGFYYSADSMKARFCKEGNEQLTNYCLQRGLPINKCGKLVVAANEAELSGLAELLSRGRANGVELLEISEIDAKEIEPRVITFQKALFSPTTSTISPRAVMRALVADARQAEITILNNTSFLEQDGKIVKTSKGNIEAGYVVNCAGLYADRIAMTYGFSQDFRILPFKGLYLYASENEQGLRTNVYPVPNLLQPFLGVHFTVDVHGQTKIGPTALPAFWREQYEGMENFSFNEFVEIVVREAGLFWNNDFGFRQVALQEFSKYSRLKLNKLAGNMVKDIKPNSYRKWGKPGIRAQLVNICSKKLEMDFCFEGDDRSFHILNAVSPAFTCSMPFARHVVNQIESLIG